MKLDFAHHDQPAAMFAVYDAKWKSGAAVAEGAAKSLHVRLLPRLAAFRGVWENERLEEVLSESIDQVSREVCPDETGVALAVALMLGGRLVLAATSGAMCMLFGHGMEGSNDNVEVVGESPKAVTECLALEDSHLGVLLTVHGVRTAPGLSAARLRALAKMHVVGERPKAGCITVLDEARKAGAEAPLVAAAAGFKMLSRERDGEDAYQRAVKRHRVAAKLSKVRIRHILLRHSGCAPQGVGGKPPKPNARSSAEAEVELVGHILELSCAGNLVTAFTTKCRAVSECDTSLRGGDLAGDLGWLDVDPTKNRKIPVSVISASFKLAVGQLSDVVSSERGVHLLLRSA